MPEYQYEREVVDSAWNVNNRNVVDEENRTISLAKVISTQWPEKGIICVDANGPNMVVKNDIGWEGSEKDELDTLVANYKNGVIP